MRPYPVSSEQASLPLGTAPRAVPISTSDAAGFALGPALAAAPPQSLPWLARPARP